MADLRNGPFLATLPVPGSSEDRQLARWLTQVILTEALCETVASDLELDPMEAEPLDGVAAVELGSINTAAYNASPWVRAMFEHVTATVTAPPEWRSPTPANRSPQPHIWHRVFPDHSSAQHATPDALDSLGPASIDSLPSAIAEALQSHPYGTLVGPVKDPLGWHVALATPAPAATHSDSATLQPQAPTTGSPPTTPQPHHPTTGQDPADAQPHHPTTSSTPTDARPHHPTTTSPEPTNTQPQHPTAGSAPANVQPHHPTTSSTPTDARPHHPTITRPEPSNTQAHHHPTSAESTNAQPHHPAHRETVNRQPNRAHIAIPSAPAPPPEQGVTVRSEPGIPRPPAYDAPTAAPRTTPHPLPRPNRGGVTLLDAARRRAFARWLDDMRAKKVELVPGLEHPGDPRQPDNHHKH